MKKNNWFKIIGLFLILSGLTVIVYPWIHAKIYDNRQQELIEKWTNVKISRSTASFEDILVKPFDEPEETPYLDEDNIIIENVQPVFNIEDVLPNIVGMINIEKINLHSPILINDSAKNLDYGICLLTNSPPIGAIGNCVLAGHNSRIKGRHFSRLDELSKGDMVSLSDGFIVYEYEVFEILKIQPEDTWVLNNVENDSIVTLITCDYTQNPKGRLIVKARNLQSQKIVDNSKNSKK